MPLLDLPHAEKLNSRRSQHNRGEAARVTRLVNEQVVALNWLNSAPLTTAVETGFEFGARKDEVMALLDRRARSLQAIEVEDGFLAGSAAFDATPRLAALWWPTRRWHPRDLQ